MGCGMTLSPPDMEERIFLPARSEPGRGGTAALSAMAHLAALGLVLTVVTQAPPAAPDLPAIPLVFSAPAPSLSEAAPAPSMVPLAAVQLVQPVSPAAPIAMPIAPHAAFHIARTSPVHNAATAAQAPARPPQSAAPPSSTTARATPQTDDAEAQRLEMAQLKDSIHAAVQALAVMPTAARRQHREGRAEVRFSYLDGAVAEVALAQSSQSRLLDDAALTAVARARYPAPPAPLRGHKLPMVLWIEFHMASSADG
jgi:periplasmic protein TonB